MILSFLAYFVSGFVIRIMDPFQFTFKDQNKTIENHLDIYLKNKSPDCILHSQDGGELKIHKELFGQTDFLQYVLSSANCCGKMESKAGRD